MNRKMRFLIIPAVSLFLAGCGADHDTGMNGGETSSDSSPEVTHSDSSPEVTQCKNGYDGSQNLDNHDYATGSFISGAFSSEEQEQIIQVEVETPDEPETGTPGGGNTWDKLFLLSYEEVLKFFPTPAKRKCYATTFVTRKDDFAIHDEGDCIDSLCFGRWWLRSPGIKDIAAKNLNALGGIQSSRFGCSLGIRPALWLKY